MTINKVNHFYPSSVSIHTPTQGVTIRATEYLQRWKVSIHTPTQGVTGRIMFIIKTGIVSIHTPTQGVTPYFFNLNLTACSFNPHTHAGCDSSASDR